MIKSKKQMFIVIGVFTIVMLLGSVTYAFFNYTRTGASNVIKTGRIYFNTSQDGRINLTNAFPIKSSDLANDVGNHDTVTINITGDTTYSEGIEYLVTLGEVHTFVPIFDGEPFLSFDINATGLGESDSDYYYNRGGNNPIYKITNSNFKMSGDYLLVGYIPKGATGINGSIDITAYLDASHVFISDTYPDRTYYSVNDNLTSEQVSQCMNILSSYSPTENFCRGTGTIIVYSSEYTLQELIDRRYININIINRLANEGIIRELYTDGTTDEVINLDNYPTIFTTSQWNTLHDDGLSFKVKVEANEGIWVEDKSTSNLCFTTSIDGVRNPNMDINTCIEEVRTMSLIDAGQTLDDETLRNYCNGTGEISGTTFDAQIGSGNIPISFVIKNIVIPTSIGIKNYTVSCGSDVVIPESIEVYSQKKNPNMTVSSCVNFFTISLPIVSTSANFDYETFCNGTGTLGDSDMKLDDFISLLLLTGSAGNILIDSGLTVRDGPSVILPITEIKGNAFKSKNITSVKIPKSITTIGANAFANNQITSLSIDMPNIPDNFASNNNLTGLTKLSIGPNVQTIGQNAFSNNSLTSLKIYNGVEEIGNNAFTGNSLTNVTVPNTVINQPWEDTGNGQCKYFDSNVTISWNNESHTCPA